jgi:hypothetical protein
MDVTSRIQEGNRFVKPYQPKLGNALISSFEVVFQGLNDPQSSILRAAK